MECSEPESRKSWQWRCVKEGKNNWIEDENFQEVIDDRILRGGGVKKEKTALEIKIGEAQEEKVVSWAGQKPNSGAEGKKSVISGGN